MPLKYAAMAQQCVLVQPKCLRLNIPLCKSSSKWHNEFYSFGKGNFPPFLKSGLVNKWWCKRSRKKRTERTALAQNSSLCKRIIQEETHLFYNEQIINNSKDRLHLLLNCSSSACSLIPSLFHSAFGTSFSCSNSKLLESPSMYELYFLLRNNHIKWSLARVKS